MKKTNKRILSIILTVVMLLGATPLTGSNSLLQAKAAYAVGDHIQYGNYPQSKVTDGTILAMLNGKTKNWVSYGYYSGNDDWDDGQMAPSDYMQYADIDLDGDGLRDYRAVTFTQYRPDATGFASSEYASYQDDNGYTTDNIYYFKYEPITWRILDPDSGLILSESILDSQAYNNYVLSNGPASEDGTTTFWGDAGKTYYANNYYYSSIRKWLNEDFCNTAFTSSQASNIRNDVTLNNDSNNPQYSAQASKDKIFLLSSDEVWNTAYGFDSDDKGNDTARMAQGTDYAKCQGLLVDSDSSSSYNGNSRWWLRSPVYYSYSGCDVYSDGSTYYRSNYVFFTNEGVRAACRLTNLKSDISKSLINNIGSGLVYAVGDQIQYGNYPQSRVTDRKTLNMLNNKTKNWVSYGYYSGTGSPFDGQMFPSDYMKYADIDSDGDGLRDYRAVTFTKYRPEYIGYTSSANNSYQDDNGYKTNNIYYFKYEPITWRVLDPVSGLIMSESILDSQPYNNFVLSSGTVPEDGEAARWGDAGKTYYAGNYYYSSIRKWLNEDFYNTAFTASQASNIRNDVMLNNDCVQPSYTQYNAPASKDKIFLLSCNEAKNTAYGFAEGSSQTADTARRAQGTDYSKCQGLGTVNTTLPSYYGNSCWWLRSPGSISDYACYVDYAGQSDWFTNISYTDWGIRAACRLANLKSDISKSEINNNIGLGLQDVSGPSCSIACTNNVAATQTVTLSLSDDIGVAGYYWGTSARYDENSYVSTTDTCVIKEISSPGTYYLTVKNTDGKVSDTCSTTFYQTTLNANNGSVSPICVLTMSGNGFVLPKPTRSGYNYRGWSTSSTATSGVMFLTPTGNTTYYAVWKNEGDIYNLGEETYSFENYSDWDSYGGHCFGMSSTSSMYYLNILDSEKISCENGNLYALTRNATVSAPICYYQSLQGWYAKKATVAGGSTYLYGIANIKADWSSVINYVKDHSHDNEGSLQIGFRVEGMGGHAINFLRYEVVEGQERIYAYDNNFPNVETYFYQDSSGKVWQKPYSTFGDNAIDCIALRDVLIYSQTVGNYFDMTDRSKVNDYITHEFFAPSGMIKVQGAEECHIDTDIERKDYVVFEVPEAVDEVTITPLVDNASFTYLGKEYTFDDIREDTSATFKLSDSADDNTATFTIENSGNQQDNCNCNCHKTGFKKFIWTIINFFNKIFRKNQYCECGAKHW